MIQQQLYAGGSVGDKSESNQHCPRSLSCEFDITILCHKRYDIFFTMHKHSNEKNEQINLFLFLLFVSCMHCYSSMIKNINLALYLQREYGMFEKLS